jgi:hypothetical protein
LCDKKIKNEDGNAIREFYIQHPLLPPDKKENLNSFYLISIQKEPRSLQILVII